MAGPRNRRSAWHWLLLIPIVVPLVTALYNSADPYLFGFPRFYWLQIVFILVGVGTTTLVYQLTKDRPGRDAVGGGTTAGAAPTGTVDEHADGDLS